MINCLKPHFKILKGVGLNDWLWINIEICNSARVGLTILGYGFIIGITFYNPTKEIDE